MGLDGLPYVFSYDKKIPSEANQLKQVETLSATFTGIKNGDYLRGLGSANRGALIQYKGPDIRPSQDIHRIKSKKAQRKLEQRLGVVWEDHVRTAYVIERDFCIGSFPDSSVKLISLGKENNFTQMEANLSQELLGTFVEQGFLEERVVQTTKKSGTLILLQMMWAVENPFRLLESAKNVICLGSGKVLPDCRAEGNFQLIQMTSKNEPLTFRVPREGSTEEDILNWMKGELGDDWEKMEKIYPTLTPGELKSLLQKLIRFRPLSLLDVPAKNAVRWTVVKLLTDPGSFVPNLGEFQKGCFSLYKRLAVISGEDSWPEEKMNLTLLGAAMLSRVNPDWTPSLDLVDRIVSYAVRLLESEKALDYSISLGKMAGKCRFGKNLAKANSYLLDRLRSFEGDCAIFRDIASRRNIPTVQKGSARKVMKPGRIFDAHCAPNIALLASTEELKGETDFGAFLGSIFHQCTGLNPRRHKIPDQNHFEALQERYYRLRVLKEDVLDTLPTEEINLSYPLHESWVAGLVGAIQVWVARMPLYVTVDVMNLHNFVVMLKPTRKTADDNLQLSETQRRNAIAKAKAQLVEGVPLKICSMESFKGMNVYYIGGVWYLGRRSAKRKRPREDELEKKECRVKSQEDEEVDSMVSFSGGEENGDPPSDSEIGQDDNKTVSEIDEDEVVMLGKTAWSELKNVKTKETVAVQAESKFNKLLRSTSIPALRRLLYHLQGFSRQLHFDPVGRDGKGSAMPVSIDDAEAYRFLLEVARLYPTALNPTGVPVFSSASPTVLWMLCDKIRSYVCSNITRTEPKQWGSPALPPSRKLWDHQNEALNEIWEQKQAGFTMSFMNITVGAGKTAVVLSFLLKMIESEQMPEYAVYTAPFSALISVALEMNRFGFKVDLLALGQNVKWVRNAATWNKMNSKKGYRYLPSFVGISKTIQPGRIVLIEHDTLRRVKEDLFSVSSNCVFIVDEVHKALADTLRTSAALQMAQLAYHTLAFTGTAVINNKFISLMYWLRMVTRFPLNRENFWTAVNSMVSREFDTGIKVDREVAHVEFTESQTEVYNALVPKSLGGHSNRIDLPSAVKVCYEACNEEMVRKVLCYWNDGVALVVRDEKHRAEMSYLLSNALSVDQKRQVFHFTKEMGSISLTDETVAEGIICDYKLVVVPMRHNAGYNLSRLGVMVQSVYFSNLAGRKQMEGRINRIGQKRKHVKYVTVEAGVLGNILRVYEQARSLSNAIQSAAKVLKIKPNELKAVM